MQRQRHLTRISAPAISRLCLLVALLPIFAINFAYAVALAFDTLPACFPYLQGCTSISSVGRVNPSQWIFKPLMLISAGLIAWLYLAAGHRTRPPDARRDGVAICGLIGACALVLYLVFLGTEGPVYRLLRRYGVSIYFGCIFLGQLLLARRLRLQLPGHGAPRWMIGIAAVLLAIGLASIPISNFVAHKDQIENVIEWNFALLLHLNYLPAWRTIPALSLPGRAPSDQQGPAVDER